MKTIVLFILLMIVSSVASAATLTWTDNSTGELGFRIERAPTVTGTFAQIGQVGVGVTTFIDAGGVAGNCYRVKAYNQGGDSAYSNIACISSPPAGPTGLTVTP